MPHALAIALAILASTQADPQPYVGHWIGEFQGQVFVQLDLAADDGVLSGRLRIAHEVHTDARGEVDGASRSMSEPRPVFDVKATTTSVTFSVKDEDDTDRFELRVTAGGEADLALILSQEMRDELAADHQAEPRPFKLKRKSS